jgi:hypothetical protein
MTDKQAKALIDQIAEIYEKWAAGLLKTDEGDRLMNGLFEIGKKIDRKKMSDAFTKATGLH